MELVLSAMDTLTANAFTAGMNKITPGQTLDNPVTAERFTFTDTAASSGGELLAFDFVLRPGGAVPIPHATRSRPSASRSSTGSCDSGSGCVNGSRAG